jgi:beta-glucanase (GH16 family)
MSEIDIELIKQSDGHLHIMFSTWTDYDEVNRNASGGVDATSYIANFDATVYHIYEYRWTATSVAFYINDALKWTSSSYVPTQELYCYMQIWAEKNPAASHGDGVNTMYVDWVTWEPYY